MERYIHRFEKHDINKSLIRHFGKSFKEYRQKWEITDKSPTSFPLHIYVELKDSCNLCCKFCYRSKGHTSTNKELSLAVFKKIIDEGAKHSLPSIGFGLSEPLMYPKIKEAVQYTREKGIMDIIIVTNGLLMTPDIQKCFIENKLTKLHISIDAATKKTYKEVRGADLDKLEDNIFSMIKLKKKYNSMFPFIRVSFVILKENRREKSLFLRKWKDKVDYIDFQVYSKESPSTVLKDYKIKNLICPMPFRMLTVFANGDIAPCCRYWGKFIKLGNIKTDSLYDCWHGKKLKDFKESFFTENYNIYCKNCVALTSGLKRKKVINDNLKEGEK